MLDGSAGDDTLGASAPLLDTLRGGGGNDTLISRDGNVDDDACGDGADTVTADATDIVAGDCESVDRA